jgi:RHS repeat-associated protein
MASLFAVVALLCALVSVQPAVALGGPVNTALPSLAGFAQAGKVLSASTGVWTGVGAISYAYQWQRCDSAGLNCSDIVGATAQTYTAVNADVGATLTVAVTAMDSGGSTQAVGSPSTLIAGSYSGVVLSDAPMAYWRLDDSSGTSATDSSGNGLAASYAGGVRLVASGALRGDSDSGVAFDGVNDDVKRAPVTTQTSNVTMEAWIYWTGCCFNFGAGPILVYNGNSGSNGYGLMISAGGGGSCGVSNQLFVLEGGVTCNADGAGGIVPTNQWVFVAATRSSSGVWTTYVNGVATTSSSSSPAPVAPTSGSTSIGASGLGGSNNFAGRIDEVAVYNTALSAARIEAHYAAARPLLASDSPNDCVLLNSLSPTLQAPAQAAASYQYQIATDAGFTSIVDDSGPVPSTNTYRPAPGALADGSTYFWRWRIGSSSWTGHRLSVSLSKLGRGGPWPTWRHGPIAVNETNGNLSLSAPGPDYPSEVSAISVALNYNSLDPANHALGAGWSLAVAGAATAAPPNLLIDHSLSSSCGQLDAAEVVYSDGSSSFFNQVGQTNTYLAAPGDGSILTKNADGTWSLTTSDGSFATFTAADPTSGAAQLTSLEIRGAQAGKGALTYSYSPYDPSLLTKITDDTGRTLSLIWNSIDPTNCTAAIVCLSGPDGVVWKYVGSASGGAVGPVAQINDGTRNVATVSYNADNRIASFQNADDLDPTHASPGYNSAHAIAIGYDGSGRATTVTDGPISDQTPPSSVWSFDYHSGAASTDPTQTSHGSLPAGTIRSAAGYTLLTPPNQQGLPSPKQDKTFYDSTGRAVETVDALGNGRQAGFDSQDDLLWTEDEAGNPSDYSYDTVNNRLLSQTGPDPDGGGPLSRPVAAYRYDETQIGTASTAGPALQGLQAFYYTNTNLAGQPAAEQTDASVDFSWGTSGPPGLGVGNNYSIRWIGDLLVSQSGAYTLSTNASDGTRLTVDGVAGIDNWHDQAVTAVSSQPITLVAGLHRIELDYYDRADSAEVHLLWACAGCSPAIAAQVIPSSVMQPAWSNLTSTVSPVGRMSFSRFNQPWTGNPDYELVQAPVNGTTSALITTYDYDSYGRVIDTFTAKGNSGRTIDANGNLQGTPDSNYKTAYAYYAPTDTAAPPAGCGGGSAVNQAGLLSSKAVHGLTAQTFIYDSAGRVVAHTAAAGTFCSSYDSEGRLTSQLAPGDSQPTTFSYDPAGNTRAASHSGSADSTVGTIASSYDEAGRINDTTDANGAELRCSYDADGNLIGRLSATGSLATSTNYASSYTFNTADQLTGETDPANRSYSFFYDSRGDLRGTQYPNGTFSWRDTNPDGWLTDALNRHGTINSSTTTAPADAAPLADFAYQYNLDGQKTQEQQTGPIPTSMLTTSGNEISDAVRSAAAQGDGRTAPDSSYGIWESTTNQVPNGGLETTTTNWVNIGAVTSSGRDTTTAKFGNASIKIIANTSSSGQGISAQTNTGLAIPAGTIETGSIWVKGTGALSAFLRVDNTAGQPTDGTATAVTLSSSWQRVSVTATVAAKKTGDRLEIRIVTASAQASTFWADGAQLEQLPLATPYLETNGATAVRGQARAQASATALSSSQSWVAIRIRTGLADSNISNSRTPTLFEWRDDASHYLKLSINSSKQWTLDRQNAGGATNTIGTGAFTPGSLFTVIAAWTASTLKLSINGAAFASVANASVPALTATSFDIASAQGSSQADSDVLWFAGGTGTLSNTDATTLNSFGNTDPTASALPATPSVLWAADTASYQTPTGNNQLTSNYSYDNLGRLETVTTSAGTSRRYCFDADSNRISITNSATTTCGSANPVSTYTYTTGANIGVDELTSQTGPSTSYTYDGDGSLTGRGSDTVCWDGNKHITGEHIASATCSGGSNTLTYTYDPVGELKTRTTTAPANTTNYLLGDLYETNSTGSISTATTDGPAGSLASFPGPPSISSTVTYLYYSGHGDLAAEADTAGTTTATHTYDAYGLPNDPTPANATAHRYTAAWNKQYDTTTNLILMGARPYDPSSGRFLATDPIDGGSLNSYDYAGQDPINKYDLDGKSQCDSHDSQYWGEGGGGQTTYGSPHCGVATACMTGSGTEAAGEAWAFVNCPAKYFCKHYSCAHGKPEKDRTLACALLVGGFLSGGGEIVEVYRGLRAGKDVIDLLAEYSGKYLGKARKHQSHIGGFGAGVTASVLTGGCVG